MIKTALIALFITLSVAFALGAPVPDGLGGGLGGFAATPDLSSNFNQFGGNVPPVLPQNYGLNANYGSPMNQPALSQAQINNIIPTQQLQQQLNARVGALGSQGIGGVPITNQIPNNFGSAIPNNFGQVAPPTYGYPYGNTNVGVGAPINAGGYGPINAGGFGAPGVGVAGLNQPLGAWGGVPATGYGAQQWNGGIGQVIPGQAVPNTLGAGFGQNLGGIPYGQGGLNYGQTPGYATPVQQGFASGIGLAQQGMNLFGAYANQPGLGGIGGVGGMGPGPFGPGPRGF